MDLSELPHESYGNSLKEKTLLRKSVETYEENIITERYVQKLYELLINRQEHEFNRWSEKRASDFL